MPRPSVTLGGGLEWPAMFAAPGAAKTGRLHVWFTLFDL